ncbi:MAG: tetratricopeptide repeat protein [Rhodospirillaceae bacterium]|nr:tetratricopeptide repeat protein [Rhodospirillaceae bacterium]
MVRHSAELEATYQAAVTLQQAGQFAAALERCAQILKSVPDYADALRLSALLHLQLSDAAGAIPFFERPVALQDADAPFWNNYGAALDRLGRLEDAVRAYDQAIAIQPLYPQAFFNRGVVLAKLGRPDQAIESYKQAVKLKADYIEAHLGLGNASRENGDVVAAEEAYRAVIRLNTNVFEAHFNLGGVLANLNRHEEALAAYKKAAVLAPHLPFIAGMVLHAKARVCEWSGIDDGIAQLRAQIEKGTTVVTPFTLLALVDDPTLHRRNAELWVKNVVPENTSLGPITPYSRTNSDKIRVGYFSMDFREHPVAQLAVELFEHHDRAAFDVTAFSFSAVTGDDLQARLKRAFPRFVDVRGLSDRDVAALARAGQIDIAVDLAGHTIHARPGIFAHRAAPLQVSYLGYPGTFGAAYMDYVLADHTVIPARSEADYVEKVVRLPHSYQANAAWREITDSTPSRAQLDLPDDGFVFACFNNTHKIVPAIFEVWMRILRSTPNSVLWLLGDNACAMRNLRAEAERRGVAPARIIFAPRADRRLYLVRQRAADLVLDTLPYNAHTTASDALRYGVPLLTCAGQSFGARVAASLLTALELSELITSTLVDYEAQAIMLAQNPNVLANLKARLDAAVKTAPLFQPQQFARYVENAYRQMHARHLLFQPKTHLYIAP